MHRLWSDKNLVRRIFEATRVTPPTVYDFVEQSELLTLDDKALSALESSYKVHRLQRMARPSGDAEFRRTLARCACVCRLFYRPAIEILWCRLPCFDALIGLLSDDIKVKKFGVAIPIIKQPLQTVQPSFFAHQTLVRSLAYCERQERTNPATVSNLLASWPSKVDLFNNVESVVWDVESHLHLYRVAPLLKPGLRALDLRSKCTPDYASTPTALLRSLADSARHLTYLSLTGSFVTPSSMPEFRRIATRLVYLTELKILQEHEWHDFPTTDEMSASSPVLDRPYFPSLEVFTMHGPATYVSDTLSAIRCYPRKRAHFRLTVVPAAADMSRLFRSLGHCPASIQHIEISMSKNPAFQEDATNRVVKGAAFRPLFRLSHLAHLELHQLGIFVDLSEDDIRKMGVAWPRLHFMGFDTHPSHFDAPDWIPTLPLESVALFAAYPKLQVLRVPICIPERGVITRLLRSARPSASSLWGLNWDISNIDSGNEGIVVTYLLSIFRNLKFVKRCSEERWEVGNMICKKGIRLLPATVHRNWAVLPVVPQHAEKWAYRLWCL